MLFHKKTKGIMKFVWTILGILIIISMIMLYTPIFTQPSPTEVPVHTAPQQEPLSEAQIEASAEAILNQ